MDNTMYIIVPNKNPSQQLTAMIKSASKNYSTSYITSYKSRISLKNKKLLFALELDDIGFDLDMLSFVTKLKSSEKDAFHNSIGAVLVHSSNDLYTKRASQDIIFLANMLGCSFIGKPLVEATGTLSNFLTWQKTLSLSLVDICLELCSRLGKRLIEYTPSVIENPKIAVLYSSPHKKSNTLDLWNLVLKNLNSPNIFELQIENGKVQDCKGCSFTLCQHYGKQNSCFYGGVMVENVLPTIETSDIVIWLCPNYNDSIAANLTAVINRLTVLYLKMSFNDKAVFSIVVSGNSGGDSVAKQLIGALNINKGFKLPPYFALMATANDPGAIFNVEDIEEKAKAFSENIKRCLI